MCYDKIVAINEIRLDCLYVCSHVAFCTGAAESSRPKRQRRASAKATEALLNVVLAADMQAWSYSHHSPRGTLAKSGQVCFCRASHLEPCLTAIHLTQANLMCA